MKIERSRYVSNTLQDYSLNGDAYVSEDRLFQLCRQGRKSLSLSEFQADLAEQLQLKKLARDGSRIYVYRTLRYENFAAGRLGHLLEMSELRQVQLPPVEQLTPLCQEQKEAVELALSNRISLIMGGAGSGKTTLIKAIIAHSGTTRIVLCAPTGKAARNLQTKVGFQSRTVHSALGMKPDDDFLEPVEWDSVDLIIVDEASMVTLEMLTGILCKLENRPNARIVLLGDPNQLPSVGSGNIQQDLLALGVANYTLQENHRQDEDAKALLYNVTQFKKINRVDEMMFDSSFELKEQFGDTLRKNFIEEAARRYLAYEDVQVLSPFNASTDLSVKALNEAIQDKVNPMTKGMRVLKHRGVEFRDGDRVIILKNDREKNCSNGDVGILHILYDEDRFEKYFVQMFDGRIACWHDVHELENLGLAYALTVHKVQGSEWDTILMPMVNAFSGMLNRNLFYTAISRAKKNMVFYGDKNALGIALQRHARKRNSMLVAKTNMKRMQQCA